MRDIMRSFQTIEKLLLGQQLLLAPALIKSKTKTIDSKYFKHDVLTLAHKIECVCFNPFYANRKFDRKMKYILHKRDIVEVLNADIAPFKINCS